jgi:hypothetical protein
MELAAFVVAEWRRDARLDAVRVANNAREGAYAACEANIARRVACGRVTSATTSEQGGFHFQVLGHRRRRLWDIRSRAAPTRRWWYAGEVLWWKTNLHVDIYNACNDAITRLWMSSSFSFSERRRRSF